MSFDVGFDTVGNATVIVHDGAPVLATDPWIVGSAYFGSWAWRTRSPRSRSTRSALPVHLGLTRPPRPPERRLLGVAQGQGDPGPDHRGSRVFEDLKAQGFNVRVMRTGSARLSPRVHVLCIPDYNQDAILLLT